MPEPEKLTASRKWSAKWWTATAIRVFLGSFGIPGLLGLLFAIFWGVPAWQSKFEFWLRVAQSTGGYAADVASVLLWPYFSPALALASIVYLGAVSRISPAPIRSRAIATIGWICITLIIVASVGVTGVGAINTYIRTEIVKGVAGIPTATSPANPAQPGNEKPLFPDAPRSLTQNQKRLLIGQASELTGLELVEMFHLASDYEARNFAMELRASLILAGVAVNVPSELFLTAETMTDDGLFIMVPDKHSPSENALKMQRAFKIIDVYPTIVSSGKSGGIALFVGRRRIQ